MSENSPPSPADLLSRLKGKAMQVKHRAWMLLVPGILVFHASYLLAGGPNSLWLVPLGIAICLAAWLGLWIALPLGFDVLLTELGRGDNLWLSLLYASLFAGQIAMSWWVYGKLAQGRRQLDDPRSAVLFLLLVPGVIGLLFALLQTIPVAATLDGIGNVVGASWLTAALGILVVTPALLVNLSAYLSDAGLARPEFRKRVEPRATPKDWTWGEAAEIAGLSLTAGILGLLLATAHVDREGGNWHFFGLSSLVIVWTSLRQGLRGGSLAAFFCAASALILASALTGHHRSWTPLQGNLLAQSSIALLVGAASSWIQASESRYRQVIGHIPVVLYSARIPRWLPIRLAQGQFPPVLPSQPAVTIGVALVEAVELTLVSPACKKVLLCEPEELLGPYARWLERVLPEDRELVVAALTQLCLQKQPITCEYRLLPAAVDASASAAEKSREIASRSESEFRFSAPVRDRWVRDTLAPHYSGDGHLDGWEGVVEEISERRALAHDLRRTTGMLHALVTHLPAGVFFVQAPLGQALLVNGRARRLLGQREDLAAGLSHLSRVYRLHRSDGSLYPWEELPVAKALLQGISSTAEDIVVHRPDGRRTPLISWSAPVDLAGMGQPDAAVWVFEDLTALRQAESAKRESESRLRAVFETMAEGAIVHNQAGLIVDCNPAACGILGVSRDQLLGQAFFARDCVREDGSPFPREELPDRQVLQSLQPVRGLVLGVSGNEARPRWLLVNAMPLSVLSAGPSQSKDSRVVTTFSDITTQREALETLRAAKARYQHLAESLPLMVFQFDMMGNVTFVNPAAQHLSGFSAAELTAPGLWLERIAAEDRSAFENALTRARDGFVARVELRFRARDESERVGFAFLQPYMQDDAVAGTTCLLLDLTAQRRLEEDLERAQRLELIGKLAGGTVHDFNNLLTVIIGRASLARAELAPDHLAHQELERIQELAEQASQLVGQLLTFSKQNRGNHQRVDLNTLAVHTLKLLSSALPANVESKVRLGSEETWIAGDEQQLRQALINLCLNSRDAMPEGGALTIEVDKASGPSSASPQDNHAASRLWAKMTVRDTGHGMAESVRARLFEPFFSTKERGTGLGLAVVRQIVESHSGRIFVHSQPDQGTAVEIWLPLWREGAPNQEREGQEQIPSAT